jgi:hypothetical protein
MNGRSSHLGRRPASISAPTPAVAAAPTSAAAAAPISAPAPVLGLVLRTAVYAVLVGSWPCARVLGRPIVRREAERWRSFLGAHEGVTRHPAR